MASDGYRGCSPSDKVLGVLNRVGGATAGGETQEKASIGLTRPTRDQYAQDIARVPRASTGLTKATEIRLPNPL